MEIKFKALTLMPLLILCGSANSAWTLSKSSTLTLLNITNTSVNQVGYVGSDMNTMADYLHSNLAISKFYAAANKAKYTSPHEDSHAGFWFGYRPNGSQVQYEIIETRSVANDTYNQFIASLPAGKTFGHHHNGYVYTLPFVYDLNSQVLADAGFEKLISGTLDTPISTSRFVYFNTVNETGKVSELIENKLKGIGILVGFTPIETTVGSLFGAYSVVKTYN